MRMGRHFGRKRPNWQAVRGPDSTPPVTSEIWLAAIEADSTGVGISAREGGDTDWTGVYQYRSRATVGVTSDITPLDQAIAPDGTSYLSPLEYFGKQRYADTGLPQYIIPHCENGTRICGASNTWGIGKALHDNSITRANAAIAAVKAIDPTAKFMGFITFGGTNDAALGGILVSDWGNAIMASVTDARGRIYQNGVSGAFVGTDNYVIMQGLLPEFRGDDYANSYETKMIELAATQPTYRYFRQAEGNSGDGIHANNAGHRLNGVGLAGVIPAASAPSLAAVSSSYATYSGQKMARKLPAQDVWYYLTGADAAQFEIAPISDLNTPGNVASSRTWFYLRWASNANAPAAGTYNVTINAAKNGSAVTSKAVTFTVLAAYGTTSATINPRSNGGVTSSSGTDAAGRRVVPGIQLVKGVNLVDFSWGDGGASDITALVASNGLVGVKGITGSLCNVWYLYSGQDETVDLIATPTGGALGGCFVNVVGTEGTVASPTSSVMTAWGAGSQVTPSLTAVGGGISIGCGIDTAGATPPAGATSVNAVFDATFSLYYHSTKRTTTGTLGATESGTGSSVAAAFAAA